jgi:hypothetical protein
MVQLVTGIEIDEDGTATCQGADGDELEPTVGWHFGFYSRPADGARGAVLKADGRGNTALLFCYRDKQYELSLQKGEAGVQNAFGASTLWDKNGNIIATPGGSGKVQLGGATTPDAAVLGTTFDAALDSFLTSMTVFNTALQTLANALVPTTGVAPGAPAAFVTASGLFAAAINTLKNANYLSQTVALK